MKGFKRSVNVLYRAKFRFPDYENPIYRAKFHFSFNEDRNKNNSLYI